MPKPPKSPSEAPSRHDVGQPFASGGMGVVHEAVDRALWRPVAYKVLHAHLGRDPAHRARFIREARMTARLQHPGIVPVHDLGIRSDGVLFYTMKRVHGRTLRDILHGLRKGDPASESEFPMGRLLSITGQICQAIHYAHTRGVLHRDLKPSNIMIGAFGEVLVMDWGLAKRIPAVSGPLPSQGGSAGAAPAGSPFVEPGTTVASDIEASELEAPLPELTELPSSSELEASDQEGELTADAEPVPGELGRSSLLPESVRELVVNPADPLGQEGSTAQSFETRLGSVLGTPAYMAPEQIVGDSPDARSDVYALGAILYSVLALRPPYGPGNPEAVRAQVTAGPPAPPHQIRPDRAPDPAVEAICLRAMARNPGDRYPTAWAMFVDLEAFLQGRAELERRRQLALERVHAARDLLDRHRREAGLGREAQARAADLLAGMRAADPLDKKRVAWAAEDEAHRLEDIALRTASEREHCLRQALQLDWACREARHALAQLYFERMGEAESAGDRRGCLLYESELRAVDDGSFARRLSAPGRLELTSNPPGIRATLSRYREIDRRMQPVDPAALGTTPIRLPALAPGAYVIVLEGLGYVTVRAPVRVRRGGDHDVQVTMFREQDIPPGFLVIPAGKASIGGDYAASRSLKALEVDLPDYAMMVFPVTMAEYLVFLNDLNRTDPDQAWARAPRANPADGQYLVRGEDGTLGMPGRDRDGHQWDPALPAMSMSFNDAVAYAEWRSRRDGLRYRLPTDAEWEKAARGVDGRIYPWGDRFDPGFCLTRASEVEEQPQPVGHYPQDESPYGVRDLAGGASDWCDGWSSRQRKLRLLRGGGWGNRAEQARAAARSGWGENNVWGDTAIRLVASLPLEPPGPGLVDDDDPRRGGVTDEHLPPI